MSIWNWTGYGHPLFISSMNKIGLQHSWSLHSGPRGPYLHYYPLNWLNQLTNINYVTLYSHDLSFICMLADWTNFLSHCSVLKLCSDISANSLFIKCARASLSLYPWFASVFSGVLCCYRKMTRPHHNLKEEISHTLGEYSDKGCVHLKFVPL